MSDFISEKSRDSGRLGSSLTKNEAICDFSRSSKSVLMLGRFAAKKSEIL